TGLDEATFKALDRDGNGLLSVTEVMHWVEKATPVMIMVRLGKAGQQPALQVSTPAAQLPKGVQVSMAAPGQPYLFLEDVKLSLQAIDPPGQQMMASKTVGPNAYYYTIFNQTRKGKDFIQVQDLKQELQFKVLENA